MSADFIAMIPSIPTKELAKVERAIIHEILSRRGIECPGNQCSTKEIEAARQHLYSALEHE
jgi:hypothetical protein